MAIVATVTICAALGAFFRFTDIGIAVRASAESGERAALLGIPVARVSTLVWMMAALLSAIAIFLRAPMVGLTVGSSIGPSVLLYGLAAAVIARMDSLPMVVDRRDGHRDARPGRRVGHQQGVAVAVAHAGGDPRGPAGPEGHA